MCCIIHIYIAGFSKNIILFQNLCCDMAEGMLYLCTRVTNQQQSWQIIQKSSIVKNSSNNIRKHTTEKPIAVNKWRHTINKQNNMAQIINYGNEMIRINTQKNTIEYSTSKGSSWNTRYSGSSCGVFSDLLAYGNEILACTSKGVYYSTSKGSSWSSRYTGSSCGTFMSLADGGNQLLATTSKGLYYSTSKGSSWSKK